jgi:hypothetical protein
MAPAGCAGGRGAAPPPVIYPSAPLEESTIESVEEPVSIRKGKLPADGEIVRASYEVEDAPKSAPLPAAEKPATETPVDAAPVVATKPPADETSATKSQPSADSSMTIKTDPTAPPGRPASKTAAVVGDTIITYRELKLAICQRLQKKPFELAQMPSSELHAVMRDTLDTLIDRTLILQEGRRDLKKPEQWKLFTDYVEKSWKERELPPMIRKAGADSEITLRQKLESIGESLDDIKDSWKMEQMSRELIMMRVQPKVEKPNLPELEAYYAQHKADLSFQRTARVNWREIVIPVSNPGELSTARQKATALRSRVLAGEPFARLAKAESAGVSAAKGGVRETAPDSSNVPGINQALSTLAIGQLSQPIEGPSAVYIVRVDSRREAGTAPFVEVQREIAEKIFGDRFQSAIASYLKRLRDKTPITSPLIQTTPGTAAVVERQAKQDPAARQTSR